MSDLSVEINRSIAKHFGMMILDCRRFRYLETGEEFEPTAITVYGIPSLPIIAEWKHQIIFTTVETENWIKGAGFVQSASLNPLRKYGDILSTPVVNLDKQENKLTESLRFLNIFPSDQPSEFDGYSYSTKIHVISPLMTTTMHFLGISYGYNLALDSIWDSLLSTSKAILKRSGNRLLENYFLQQINQDDIAQDEN